MVDNSINPNISNENSRNSKYTRDLSFLDLFFAGYGFIVGAGIFSLIPYIIKYSKGHSAWGFIIGGLICLITGLSYSKLNSIYPSNDAEYIWITKILNFDKKRDPKKITKIVDYLANIIIWIVVVIGFFTGATILVGQADFIRQYTDVSKPKIIGLMLAIPTLIVMSGNKTTTALNKIIMIIITAAFFLLFGQALGKGNKYKQIDWLPQNDNFNNLIKSSFITIFAYNGFQSIVQLSEESKNKNDIPKSIISSTIFSTIIYALITISVIALIGVKKAAGSVSPLADAFGVYFGRHGINIVNLIAIIALTNTMLILTMSRSRLLQKLAERGIAPLFLKKLNTIKGLIGGNDTKKSNKLPMYSIITLSAITYLITFIRGGAVEYLAGLTNSFIFIIFTLVHSLVLVFYFKYKTPEEKALIKESEKLTIIKGFPWFATIGLPVSLYYLYLSTKYLDIIV